MTSMNILVSGTSGPIGGALVPALTAAGHRVTRLVRHPPAAADEVEWGPEKPIAPDTVSGYDAVVHLSGEPIVGHWDQKKKQKIRDSRIQHPQPGAGIGPGDTQATGFNYRFCHRLLRQSRQRNADREQRAGLQLSGHGD